MIFVAPTRPLIQQQIAACHAMCGWDQADVAEMTGKTAARERHKLWTARRVFFLTAEVRGRSAWA